MKKEWKVTGLMALALAGALALGGCGQSSTQTQGEAAAEPAGEQAGAAESEAGETDGNGAEAAQEGTEKVSAEAETGSAEVDGQLAQIKEKGELIVAMEGTWSPWTYHDENDELVGYDVEVAKAIGEKLGVQVTFVEGEWDGLFAGMDAGRYDMVVNGVDITEERAEKYDFSVPYAYNRTAIIVKGSNEEIQTFEDLEGKNTANTISSTYAELAESYGASVTAVDDLNQTFELLMSGRIDATLNAELTYYDYVKAHPDADIRIAALTEEASQVAIPMRKGAETESLRKAVNEAIEELRADGTLAELSGKYFGSDVSGEPQAE